MKKIRTVCGDISPDELGFTSMHDHTFLNLEVAGGFMESMFPGVTQEMVEFKPENYGFLKTGTYLMCKELQRVDDMEGLVKEFGYFKGIGGSSVVDPSPSTGLSDPLKTRDLARRTGLHIIMATGVYHETAIPEEYRYKDADFYYSFMKNEVENGISGTDVKPGVLKGALASGCDMEQAVVEACIRLSSETGMLTNIHTEPMMDGDTIVELLDSLCEKYGLDHDRVLVCHMDNRIAGSVPVVDYLEDPGTDRTLDLELQKTLLSKGYNIGLDTWGMPVENENFFMPDDFERLKALITLADLGYVEHIALGNDFSSKLMWRQYGGHGCTRFADFGLKMMEMLGRDEQVHKLAYENPARMLAF